MTLIETRSLSVSFEAGEALRGLSFRLDRGERLALVGESGSGKTIAALALMGMAPEAARVSGEILLDGARIDGLSEPRWAALRGARLAMAFQEPMTALNPIMRIGAQIAEGVIWRERIAPREAWDRAARLLAEVGLPEPEARLRQYPHELSGGQRQRALIALALAGDPDLLIADEPTTALDPTRARQVLDLLRSISERRGLALVLISHDLAAVRRAAGRIVVLYGGDPVEQGPVEAVLGAPAHPYTAGLLRARPKPRPAGAPRRRLETIPGVVPALGRLGAACRFADRCPRVVERCRVERPTLTASGGRAVACFRPLATIERAAE